MQSGEIVTEIVNNPKTAWAVASAATATGYSSMIGAINGWISFAASVVGLLLATVLLITHSVKLLDYIHNRKLNDDSEK